MAPTQAQTQAIEKAERERESSKCTIEWLEKKLAVHATTPLTKVKVERFLTTLAFNRDKVEETFQRIVANCDPEEVSTHKAQYEYLMDRVTELECEFVAILSSFPTTPIGSGSPGPNPHSDIRLPRLNLPTFDGKIEEWTSFRDMFTTAIHTNSKLSNTQKLTYLKTQVKGEAARLIQSLVISEANYEIAWKQLGDRYQNDRQLLFAILKRLINQPTISNPSSAALRSLVDVSSECIRSLEVLAQPVSQWGSILLFLLYQKLDTQSREQYEQSLKDSSVPLLQGLFDFLEQRSRALEAGGSKASLPQPKQVDRPRQQQPYPPRNHVHHAQNSSPTTEPCKICTTGSHLTFKCIKFLGMGVPDRWDVAKATNLCYNCLRTGHSQQQCNSASCCKQCNKRHHTLLHRTTPAPAAVSQTTPSLTHHSKVFNTVGQTLLATAIIHVCDAQGQHQKVRVLLDGGSDTHIITSKCIKRLGLRWVKQQALVTGLSATPVGTTLGVVDVSFSPHFNDSLTIEAKQTCIMQSLTAHLPLHPCSPDLAHLNGLELADQGWHTPAEIDMLIGASLFYGLISGERVSGSAGQPFGLNSDLGWLVVGEIESSNSCSQSYHANVHLNTIEPTLVTVADVDLDQRLRSFWELETLPETLPLSQEEKACEDHFMSTHIQLSDGKFSVQLPFKSFPPNLGPTRDMAVQRLKQLERRLARLPQVHQEYREFMKEYLELGHMQEIPQDEIQASNTYYIPHHFVVKQESTTTKLRVVFDASARSSSGKSLNDCLMVGATIQQPLYDILLRFRTHPIAFTADIAKMYRQIIVSKSDANYQRIVWRDNPESPIKDYRLLTVTYGTAPAPFLATRVLQQLAQNHAQQFPLASKIALSDFYVDDCMSGAETISEALEIQQQLLSLMKLGGLQLRKWSSTHDELISSLPVELRETKSVLPVELGHTIKALGIYWQPTSDHFFFKIHDMSHSKKQRTLTKRSILSDIAKIFDPIGWLAPVVITAKIMMQTLWTLELGWDDPVPTEIEQMWTQYMSDLKGIEAIHIPRCIKPQLSPTSELSLIGFSDASQKAYAAMVYLVVYNSSSTSPPYISLITSKTRVAPTKTVSIPRLELCSAELLAKLMEKVQKALQLNYRHTSAWTDSSTTYDWIQASPSRWERFVANRVSKIQARILPSQWGHVSGVDNPSDCATRGLDPHSLRSFSLWWNGPVWLMDGNPTPAPPVHRLLNNEICMEERKDITVHKVQIHPFSGLMQNVSCFMRLQRITAWMFRFVHNTHAKAQYSKAKEEQPRKSMEAIEVDPPASGGGGQKADGLRVTQQQFECLPEEETGVGCAVSQCGQGTSRQYTPIIGPLQPEELSKATEYWVRLVQNEAFPSETLTLRDPINPHVTAKSNLLPLNPFLDENGIIRVGGRIHRAQLGFDQRHPIILPRHSPFTRLLMRFEHERNFHAGPQLLLSIIQAKYWILRGRDAVRHLIRQCVSCTKQRASTMQQLMADLPKFRVTPARAFSKCGVDYAGPFLLKGMVPRSKSTIKAYLCLFVCCVTRAVHLELVSSLSTDAFMASLRRFTARRGRPSNIYSDCGTNFVGANRQLKELVALCSSKPHNEEISNQLSIEGIHWNFNPPGAPHFGGIWESGVKSVKYHLIRTMGSTRLNYEEMTTTLTQIEALLNSRPITPESSDPSDFSALTPGHFLIGSALNAAPDVDVTALPTGRLNRWQLIQQMYQSFWKRWSGEYLTRLQQRPKWMIEQRNISIGDLVTIKDENLPPMSWRLGRVVEMHPGADGHVRVVTLKTKDGSLKRPIAKLCLLPVHNSDALTNDNALLLKW